MIASITPKQLAELHASGKPVDLIDVRTPVEYRELRVPFARSVPLGRLDAKLLAEENGRDGRELYLICGAGKRSMRACERLAAAGLKVVNVAGGTNAWCAAGLPVVRGQAGMSLQRQVQIGAGTLVLLGVLLALAVHPYWIGLSALVGAGLVFAGVTNTCGMAILLMYMPWNQRPVGGCGAPVTKHP